MENKALVEQVARLADEILGSDLSTEGKMDLLMVLGRVVDETQIKDELYQTLTEMYRGSARPQTVMPQ